MIDISEDTKLVILTVKPTKFWLYLVLSRCKDMHWTKSGVGPTLRFHVHLYGCWTKTEAPEPEMEVPGTAGRMKMDPVW